MANGHQDVNLPPHTVHRAGNFLAEFHTWVRTLGISAWIVDKPPGNHLTDFWVYARLDSSRPAMSKVSFGCTRYASVNPQVHAYARGKPGEYLASAVRLLQHFIDQVWAFEEQTPAVEPSPAPQRDDSWQALDLRQYQCPSSGKVWFSDGSCSVWFVPDDSGARSTCGKWQKYQYEAVGGDWWCNESSLQLYFPGAA